MFYGLKLIGSVGTDKFLIIAPTKKHVEEHAKSEMSCYGYSDFKIRDITKASNYQTPCAVNIKVIGY